MKYFSTMAEYSEEDNSINQDTDPLLANEAECSDTRNDELNPEQTSPFYGALSLAEIGVRDSSEMISTPFGKGRRFKFLGFKDRVLIGLILLSFSPILVFTIWRLVTIDTGSADFTVGIVILMNILFFLYYVTSGIFYERPYEIADGIVSALVIWLYLVINYALSRQGFYKMLRLIIASAFYPFIMVISAMMIRSYLITNSVVFRHVGANKVMQERAKTLYIYLALIKIDLQVAFTMAFLILKDGVNFSLPEKIFFPVVLAVAVSSYIIGYAMVRFEKGKLVLTYIIVWFLIPAYSVYLIIQSAIYIQKEHRSAQEHGLTAVIFLATVLSLIIRVCIIYFVLRTFLNFGAGLRERVFEGFVDAENREKKEDDFDGVAYPASNDSARLRTNAQLSTSHNS